MIQKLQKNNTATQKRGYGFHSGVMTVESVQHRRRRQGGRVAERAVALPNSGEKVFFGKTSCNILAVNIFLEERRTGTLYFLTVFCFSFHVYVK